MSKLRIIKSELIKIGFEPISGEIKTIDKIKNGIKTVSLSINLENINHQDIDYIIEDLKEKQQFLKQKFIETIDSVKSI